MSFRGMNSFQARPILPSRSRRTERFLRPDHGAKEQHPGPIHLLVTDIVMPGMSGREVGLLLTQMHPEMRALYLSGYPDESVVHEWALAPGTPFLQKPFTGEALARKVREVLDAPASA
jgi:FixJ family two-component response regulator